MQLQNVATFKAKLSEISNSLTICVRQSLLLVVRKMLET